MATTKKVKRVRDITMCEQYTAAAQDCAEKIQAHAEDGEYSPAINQMLLDNLASLRILLRDLNASTGKREKHKGPALTPVGGASGAKNAGKRGR